MSFRSRYSYYEEVIYIIYESFLIHSSQNEIIKMREDNERKLADYENKKVESLAVRDTARRDQEVRIDYYY